jgi:hypothetical protein
LEDVRETLSKGANVNLSGRNGATPLMTAIAAANLDKMKLLVANGADPELSDDFNGTALRHAVSWDFAEGVRYLLNLGVDRGYRPKYPLKKTNYSLSMPESPLPEELKGVITEDEWKAMVKEGRKALIESDENPTVDPIISEVQSIEVLKLFLDAGDDLSLAPSEVRRTYLGLPNEGTFEASTEDYKKYRSPRFGDANPEPMDNPFWRDMVRLGGNAYSARDHFGDSSSQGDAVWCFDRFGSSVTPLPDGRFVQIAGEHEDFYDPDFHIYNDVVIHDGKGDFKILGYPDNVFPPTDFHTATLAGDSIYIVGCLGYMEQREIGKTPVFRLDLETWEIDAVTTSGEMPSWLHDHRAFYDSARNVIQVEGGKTLVAGQQEEADIAPNEARYELDLVTFHWRKVE